ncbi:replication-relaxation family protein [Paenibacillus allorhizosphaerae]|uniref:replication-relaxation family protein n=1 Tax=Paenibacillus allorhizosphaerae TaxID=2849866 RepID=UPI001C402CB7|nr:replication-relaxation family protein [Paenibacillus allorhizosphaerae]
MAGGQRIDKDYDADVMSGGWADPFVDDPDLHDQAEVSTENMKTTEAGPGDIGHQTHEQMEPTGSVWDPSSQEDTPKNEESLFNAKGNLENPKEAEGQSKQKRSEETSSEEMDPSSEDGDADEKGSGKKPKRRNKPVERRGKPLDRTEADLVHLILKNSEAAMVLHSLYVHRRLTSSQIRSLFFRHKNEKAFEYLLNKLNHYRVFEREYIFNLAKKKGDFPIHYSLSPFGIRLYARAVMDISLYDEEVSSTDKLPKQHYLYKDLLVRDQDVHHFVLQAFLSNLLGSFWEKEIYLPSSEWRRFLYTDPAPIVQEGEKPEVPYRPDWVVFSPNKIYSDLVRSGSIGKDILNVPVHSRNEEDNRIIKGNYRPLLSVESDTGTMSSNQLETKFKKIQTVLSALPKGIAFVVAEGSMGKVKVDEEKRDQAKRKSRQNKIRLRTIAEAAEKSIKDELLSDQLQLMIGWESTLTPTTEKYISSEGELKSCFHLSDISYFYMMDETRESLFPSYSLMSERDWATYSITTGLPDIGLIDRQAGKIIAIYFALPHWVNPQIKVNHLLGCKIPDLKCVLLYPDRCDIDTDAHIANMEVLCLTMQDIQQNKRTAHQRTYDRRTGVKWGEMQTWPF